MKVRMKMVLFLLGKNYREGREQMTLREENSVVSLILRGKNQREQITVRKGKKSGKRESK